MDYASWDIGQKYIDEFNYTFLQREFDKLRTHFTN